MDENLVAQLRADYRTAPLCAADRAMLDFAVQITKDATRISPDSHAALKQHGFDETAIVQMTLIASFFNYINRVADALGVGRDDEAVATGTRDK